MSLTRFKYDLTLTIFDGRYDREIDCEGEYSVNIGGAPTDWRIETCNHELNEWDWSGLEEAIADQIDGDIADWLADQDDPVDEGGAA